jgi:hypothetical protein
MMEDKKMLAKTFQSLMNGGAKLAGVAGLEAAIRGIEGENAECRRELSIIPTRRDEAILADDHDKALDELGRREDLLYRSIERGDRQISELYVKLAEHRSIGLVSRLEKHRAAVAETMSALDAAIMSAVEANEAVIAALELGKHELGVDAANKFLPFVHFVGFLNNQCLKNWREFNASRAEQSGSRPQTQTVSAPRLISHEGRQNYERS